MELKKLLYCLIAPALLFAGCASDEEENTETSNADQVANRWIYGKMKDIYLWNDDMPSSAPSFKNDYLTFFEKLLSENDGKHVEGEVDYYYSYIYKDNKTLNTRAGEDYYISSYGFDYIITQSYLYDSLISKDNAYRKLYATVVYVTSGSPADSARLKRGDHIYKVANKEITSDTYRKQLASLNAPRGEKSSVTFTLCDIEPVKQFDEDLILDNGDKVRPWIVTRKTEKEKGNENFNITLTSNVIEQDPVYRSRVIETGGKKIGYLVYNEFERGGTAAVYDNRLRTAFSDFVSRGISELVLDIRYNPGGYVTSSQILASLIVPAAKTGTVFHQMEDNKGALSPVNYISEPYSVGLRRVYILASRYSASASEALIHGLRGSGIEVYHIGTRTEGKNVGMSGINTESLQGEQRSAMGNVDYYAWPVTFTILDANGETYSPEGLVPDYTVYEEFEVDFLELGDPEEPLLKAAIHHITNGRFPTRAAAVSRAAGGSYNLVGAPTVPRNVKPSKGYLRDK